MRAPERSMFARAIRRASNSREGGRWINNVSCGCASAIEDVLFPAAPVHAFLELLVELLVELDRVRVDARTHDLHGLLEVRRRDLLRVLRLAQCDHRGLAAQALDIRPGIGVEVHGELFQVHALEGHVPGMDLEDREARILFSDSPTHFDMTSGPLIEMKFASDSVATAFARRVFPDPGGPYSRMPRGGRMPMRLNASGSFSGISTASRSFILTSSRPPTSDQFTRGTSTRTSRMALGSTSFRAILK